MWPFLTQLVSTETGGCGFFVFAIIACVCLTRVLIAWARAISHRRKP